MPTFEKLTKSQKLRASLHRDVMAICKETCHLVGMEMEKPAMEVVAELLYKKIKIYALDLEAFAKHAKRSTINADDVLLLARRNPSLKAHLKTTLSKQPSTSKERRRKTNASKSTTPKETVKSKAEVDPEKAAADDGEGRAAHEMEDALDIAHYRALFVNSPPPTTRTAYADHPCGFGGKLLGGFVNEFHVGDRPVHFGPRRYTCANNN
ncbi:unnamed protein product, partial [Iphiclides podalirius]